MKMRNRKGVLPMKYVLIIVATVFLFFAVMMAAFKIIERANPIQ